MRWTKRTIHDWWKRTFYAVPKEDRIKRISLDLLRVVVHLANDSGVSAWAVRDTVNQALMEDGISKPPQGHLIDLIIQVKVLQVEAGGVETHLSEGIHRRMEQLEGECFNPAGGLIE